jgi:aryl-alcohol dehydrogenase-like predicted oxidoreductase
MKQRNLGRSGLKITPICLGAMMFGWHTDEEVSSRIIGSARAAGVNFIDIADAYAGGRSEQIVGRAVKADRDRWVIATKVGYPVVPGTSAELSRKYILRAVDDSLRRLDTDYIDLYYLHRDDAATPLEETVRTLADLIRDVRLLQTELRPESLALAREIKAHAEARGSTVAHFALQWVLNNSLVSSVIAGPRTMAQWEDYLKALDAPFTPEDEALVDRLVAPGHPSTPGYTDPQYPVTGRVPVIGAAVTWT